MNNNRRRAITCTVFEMALLVSTALGIYFNRELETVPVVVGTIIATVLLLAFVKYLFGMKTTVVLNNKSSCREPNKIIELTGSMFFIWGVIFFLWFPVFLAYYPVLFNYDVANQFAQILNDSYNTFHPLAHTLLCKLFFQVGQRIGSVNTGFALYSVFQMLVLSGCIAYSIHFLVKNKCNKRICFVIVLWFGLFPANPILAISMTKDVLFSAFFLMTVVLMVEWNVGGYPSET